MLPVSEPKPKTTPDLIIRRGPILEGADLPAAGGYKNPPPLPKPLSELVDQIHFGPPPKTMVPGSRGSDIGLLEGTLKSLISAGTVEQVGINPIAGVEEFQDEHPILGTTARIVGYAAPFMLLPEALAGKAVLPLIPGVGRMVGAAETLAEARPVTGAAINAIADVLPYETLRLGGSAAAEAAGHEGALKRTAESVGLDLGFIGAFGAGGQLVRQVRSAASVKLAEERAESSIRYHAREVQKTLSDFDSELVPQEMWLQAKTAKAGVEKMNLPQRDRELLDYHLDSILRTSESDVLKQVPPVRPGAKSANHVLRLEDGKATKRLNALFEPGKTPDLGITRKFVVGKEGFKSPKELTDAIKAAELPEDFISKGQYFRHLTTKGPEEADNIRLALNESLKKVDPTGLWISKEADGLYVVVKKIATKPGERVRYALFKTHDPGSFFPGLNKSPLAEYSYKIRTFDEAMPAARGSRALSEVRRLTKKLPDIEGGSAAARGRPLSSLEKPSESNLVNLRREVFTGLRELGRKVKPILAPTGSEFSQSARATRLLNIARESFAGAARRASELFYGTPIFESGVSGFRTVLLGRPKYKGGLKQTIDKVFDNGPEAIRQWNTAVILGMTKDEVKAAGMRPSVLEAIRAQDKIEGYVTRQMLKTQEAVGEEGFVPLENHRLIMRKWRGDYRTQVLDESGKFVDLAGGMTAKESQEMARNLARRAGLGAEAGGESARYTVGETILSGQVLDGEMMAKLAANTRSSGKYHSRLLKEYDLRRFKERTGVGGFIGDMRPMTREEALQNLHANIIDSELHMTHQSLEHYLNPELLKLAEESPELVKQLKTRMESMRGWQGPVNKVITAGLNKVMAKFLGNNAADKIVRGINRAQYALTLGFMDLGYPIVNMMSIFNQLIPEASLMLNAAPESLAHRYTWSLVANRQGVEAVGTWEPMKHLFQTLRELRSPSDEILGVVRKGLADGNISPAFIEQFAGQHATVLSRWREVLKGQESLAKYLLELQEFPGAKSEELSRAISLVYGYRMGKEFFRLEPENAYRLAVEMTRRAMYGYATAERPRILTGVLGQGFGLFKNYSANFTANLINYTDEALLRHNWAPLLWQMGTTGALGGAAAMPLYKVADYFSEAFTDKGIAENLYTLWNEVDAPGDTLVADTFFYGLPAALPILPFTVQGRVAAPFADPVRDVELWTSIMALDRAAALGNAFGEAVQHWKATGGNPLSSKAVWDQLHLAFAPRTLNRIRQTWENGLIRSLRNQNALTALDGYGARLQYVFGFTPLEVEKSYEAMDILEKDQDSRRDKVAMYGEAWAWSVTDPRGKEIRYRIMRKAHLDGIPISSILRSANTRINNHSQGKLERSYDEVASARVRRIFGLGQHP